MNDETNYTDLTDIIQFVQTMNDRGFPTEVQLWILNNYANADIDEVEYETTKKNLAREIEIATGIYKKIPNGIDYDLLKGVEIRKIIDKHLAR